MRLAIALVFLYKYVHFCGEATICSIPCSILGWSALAGVVVVLVAYVLNYPLAKYNIYVRCRRRYSFRRTGLNFSDR